MCAAALLKPAEGEPAHVVVEIVIRFKNSATTLPGVLESLASQSFRDYRIIGVDTGSTDGSVDLIRKAGGRVIHWEKPYSHPGALNFGIELCTAPLVLALSSHTAFEAPDVLGQLVAAFDDPAVACVSGKWDEDPFYSDVVDWPELQAKGLKLGSIYSNSMGMIRREWWIAAPFDETIEYAEDYAWAVDQLSRGRKCMRLTFPFRYERAKHGRSYFVSLAVFTIAKRHGVKVAWLGPRQTAQKIASLWLKRLMASSAEAKELLTVELGEHLGKFKAWQHSRR